MPYSEPDDRSVCGHGSIGRGRMMSTADVESGDASGVRKKYVVWIARSGFAVKDGG